MEWFHRSLQEGLACGGICQPSTDKEGSGYDLLCLASGERVPFARRKPAGKGYDFQEEGWAWAAARLEEAFATCRTVFVDEMGWQESQGLGHMRALLRLLESSPTLPDTIVMGVQAAPAREIGARLGGFDQVVDLRNP